MGVNNWSVEQFKHYLNTGQAPQEKPASKYNAQKVESNGIQFDSKKEQRRYAELMAMLQGGLIENLRLQETFVLKRAYTTAQGERIRAISYKADFTYTQNGARVIEDVKGYKHGQAYANFTMKKKLMHEVYGIEVQEV